MCYNAYATQNLIMENGIFLAMGILYPFLSYHIADILGKIVNSSSNMINVSFPFLRVLCSDNRGLRLSVHSLIGVHFFYFHITKEIN